RAEIEGLIGFFVNTLVLRTDLSGDPTFAELVTRVRAEALAAYAHQDLPFEHLVEALRPDRDRSRTPLFQVMFDYTDDQVHKANLGGLGVSGVGRQAGAALFDLTFSLGGGEDGLAGVVEYSTALFDRSTIQRLVERFAALLEALAAGPGEPLSAVPVLPAQ